MSEVQALAQLDRPNFQYQFINIIMRVQDMLRASTPDNSVGLSRFTETYITAFL